MFVIEYVAHERRIVKVRVFFRCNIVLTASRFSKLLTHCFLAGEACRRNHGLTQKIDVGGFNALECHGSPGRPESTEFLASLRADLAIPSMRGDVNNLGIRRLITKYVEGIHRRF